MAALTERTANSTPGTNSNTREWTIWQVSPDTRATEGSNPGSNAHTLLTDEVWGDPNAINDTILAGPTNANATWDVDIGFTSITDADFGSMTSATVTCHMMLVRDTGGGISDDTFSLSMGFYDSTGTTAYTSGANYGGFSVTGWDSGWSTSGQRSFQNSQPGSMTSAGLAASKADWDACRLRLTWDCNRNMAGDGWSVGWRHLSVAGSYTPQGSLLPHRRSAWRSMVTR